MINLAIEYTTSVLLNPKLLRDDFGFTGHDDCGEDVGEDAAADAEDEQNPCEADKRRVDVEIFGETAANACNTLAVFDTIEALGHELLLSFLTEVARVIYWVYFTSCVEVCQIGKSRGGVI